MGLILPILFCIVLFVSCGSDPVRFSDPGGQGTAVPHPNTPDGASALPAATAGAATAPNTTAPVPALPTDGQSAVNQEQVLKGLKICIDPGHQRKGNSQKEPFAPWSDQSKAKCTSGACGSFTKIDEYITNLEIALRLNQKLTALGADVLLTRDNHDVNLSNLERAELSNRFGADITLRIHCNAADSPDVEGIELYVRDQGDGTQAYRERSDADAAAAQKLLQAILQETGATSRGVKRSDGYTGINWCQSTCIIIECGFITNEKEDRLLNTAAYQEKLADGIVNYFISSRVSSDKKISGL